jgi:methionyl-tRNA formyltransferase
MDMRVLYVASGPIAIPSLRWLIHSDHELAVVVTQPDRPSGRGRHVTPPPIKELALSAGLTVLQPDNINDAAIVKQLSGYDADLGITMSFGQFLGSALLKATRAGWINIHPSLLPRYRGAAPVNWAIIRGETKTGVTIYTLTRRMDAGPVLVRRETMIKPDETVGELQERLGRIAPDALQAVMKMSGPDGLPCGEPQDDAQATFAPKLTKEMGAIDLNRPAQEVAAWVNGLYPWPAVRLAYASVDGQRRIEVHLARATSAAERRDPSGLSAGTVRDDGTVACAEGAIRILQIQPAGGRVMTWQDFVNGRHVRPGDRFESLRVKSA